MRHQTLSHQRRAPVEEVLARIATDPGYRQSLRDDPAEALRGLVVEPAGALSAEVFGYWCKQTCGYQTCRISCVTK